MIKERFINCSVLRQLMTKDIEGILERLSGEERLELLRSIFGSHKETLCRIAHDFNNSLTGINGGIALISMEGTDSLSDNQREGIKIALASYEQLSSVTRRITNSLMAMQPADDSTIDLHKATGAAFAAMGEYDGIRMENLLSEGQSVVWADMRLNAALTNIVLNAAEALQAKGITPESYIRASAEPYRQEEDSVTLPKGEYVHLTIEDKGIGMSAECRRRAFEPFYSPKRQPGERGKGLGLTEAYSIIRGDGKYGHIEIESTEGEGTRVHIYLPVAKAQEEKEELEQKVRTGRILAVDDEGPVRTVISRMLGASGYDVITAASGQEGLDKLRENSDVALVMTDLTMPGMSGSEFMEAALAEYPDMPFMVVTGYGQEHKGGVLAQAKAVITKPFDMKTVKGEVSKYVSPSR
jgi:CheY-like chemotaxis protein